MKKLFSIVLIAVLSLGVSRAQTVIFTEDFGSGAINPSWANGGTANGVGNPNVKWRFSHTGSHGAYSSGASDIITSPTAANGFILFDSDSLDNGGHTLASGQPDPTGGPANAPQYVALTSSAISVAGTPYCKLSFYQYFRNFQSTTVVGISTDSVNWTLDTINTSVAVNAQTAHNNKVTIDLSPYISAGGSPSPKVYISFIMDANYYFWMIDDISITTLPNNDLSVVSTTGQSGTSGLGLFYASIPASEADSFAAFTTYGNIGQSAQPNTVVNQKELRNGVQIGSTYTTTPPVALLPYGMDTVDGNIWQTQGIGKYIISATVASDSTDFDPTNNTDSLSFAVTDTVFSINTTTAQNASSYFLLRNNAGLSFRLGSLFELDNADTVTSVTTAVAGGTEGTHAGTVLQATIYPVTVTSTAITYGTAAVTSFPKTLVANDITGTTGAVKPVTLKIDNSSGNPVLQPGVYWAAIGALSTPDSNVLLCSTNYQTNGFPIVEENGTLYYLSSTDAAYCNMNFGHPSSILTASWTRNPVTTPVRATVPVTFQPHTNASGGGISYSWTVNDNYGTTIYSSGSSVMVFAFPNNPGAIDTYSVCLTVHAGTDSASYCNNVIVKSFGSSIDEVSGLSNTSLVPNPTTGKVTISADVTGPVSISVVNMLGETVRTYNEEAGSSFSKSYDMSALSSGIYLVKIANGGSVATKRLSISK